jgi:hypothetical protein
MSNFECGFPKYTYNEYSVRPARESKGKGALDVKWMRVRHKPNLKRLLRNMGAHESLTQGGQH